MGKTFIAGFVLSFLLLPLKIVAAIPAVDAFLSEGTQFSNDVGVTVGFFILFVYVPFVFYVAATHVGFYPSVVHPGRPNTGG